MCFSLNTGLAIGPVFLKVLLMDSTEAGVAEVKKSLLLKQWKWVWLWHLCP